jgi:hypothetical protein
MKTFQKTDDTTCVIEFENETIAVPYERLFPNDPKLSKPQSRIGTRKYRKERDALDEMWETWRSAIQVGDTVYDKRLRKEGIVKALQGESLYGKYRMIDMVDHSIEIISIYEGYIETYAHTKNLVIL